MTRSHYNNCKGHRHLVKPKNAQSHIIQTQQKHSMSCWKDQIKLTKPLLVTNVKRLFDQTKKVASVLAAPALHTKNVQIFHK